MRRTTAMGLFTDSRQMMEAARIIHLENDRLTQPIYYLLGHSTELALKATLLAEGTSLSKLKYEVGHDLSEAATRVLDLRHNSISTLVQEKLPAIGLLNDYYKSKEFEYRVTGIKQLPHVADLLSFLDALLKEVRLIVSSGVA